MIVSQTVPVKARIDLPSSRAVREVMIRVQSQGSYKLPHSQGWATVELALRTIKMKPLQMQSRPARNSKLTIASQLQICFLAAVFSSVSDQLLKCVLTISAYFQTQLTLQLSCTVGDLVGFTAWSSAREPHQVFVLLETLYNSFDKVAKKLGVFKVMC